MAQANAILKEVLILVLMEYGLWLGNISSVSFTVVSVLILVLMEYGLWQFRHLE